MICNELSKPTFNNTYKFPYLLREEVHSNDLVMLKTLYIG
jgi:hypothetical protein